jgi:hypothetical protein
MVICAEGFNSGVKGLRIWTHESFKYSTVVRIGKDLCQNMRRIQVMC